MKPLESPDYFTFDGLQRLPSNGPVKTAPKDSPAAPASCSGQSYRFPALIKAPSGIPSGKLIGIRRPGGFVQVGSSSIPMFLTRPSKDAL